MFLDFEELSAHERYRILIGSVLPRPIAWVSTLSKNGVPNLAPFSFFTVASSNPPILCFAPALKQVVVDGVEKSVPKDTLKNIQDTKEFVVNIVSQKLAQQMNDTSGEYPEGVNEFEVAKLKAVPSERIKPSRVGESMINFECKLHQIIEFGDQPGAGRLVLGQILCAHVSDTVYQNGRIDLDILEPIGRMAGMYYCTTKERFEILRPQVDGTKFEY